MKTLKLTDDKKGVKAAARLLKQGKIVAIPTETVYGLAASAYDDNAIKKVFEAKGRPQDNPLIVHIAEFSQINELISCLPEEAARLANSFWPGPLTLVLPKSDKVAKGVSAGLDTVAVRMPANEIARSIINESGLPLAAPSANLSGSPSPTSAEHVVEDLDGKIDAVVLSDDCTVGVESTVVSLAVKPPRLLRPGAVTLEQLKEILPDIVVDKAVLSKLEKGAKAASPGMMYKHYSPETEVFLVEAESEEFCGFVNSQKNIAAICFEEDKEKLLCKTLCMGKEENEEEHAKLIFNLLRKADKLSVEKIYVHAPQKTGVGLAVYNRLIRAAGFKVIKPKHIIGLTGPTGAGKTTACKAAKELGFYVIDCDKTARMATEDKECLEALSSAFGKEIINKDGSLDRPKLARLAFETPDKTELLNKTIFPFITKLIEDEIENCGNNKILLDAPTLYESKIDSICQKVIAITADKKTRLERILQRDGIGTAAAELRLNAGKTDDFYKSKTPHIIYNNGDEEKLLADFKKLLNLNGR